MNMQSYPQKFVSTLDADGMRKIFPQRFYTKYGNHLRILQFQKNLATKDLRDKGRMKFVQHNNNERTRISTNKKGVQSEKKIRMTRYDDIQYIIEKNKEEVDRMNQYRHSLKLKLERTPPKRQGFIRIHRENIKQPDPQVIQNMNIIEQQQYQNQLPKNSKDKHQDKVKFIKKHKKVHSQASLGSSIIRERTKINTQISYPSNSQSHKVIFNSVKKQLKQLVRKSEEFNNTLNPQVVKADQVSFIMNLNNAIKQGMNIIKKAGLENYQRQISKIIKPPLKIAKPSDQFGRKDLNLETQLIREKTASLKVQNGYDQLERTKNIRSFINEQFHHS